MAAELADLRVLMFVEDVYEDLELWYPKLRLGEAGAHVTVAGPESGRKYHGKHSYPCIADAAIADMEAADFHGLVVPGGFMPDKLRRDPKVLSLVRAFAEAGKLVAAICHGPWLLVEADAVRGRKVTSYKSIRRDVENAGGKWVDAEVAVDDGIITSRSPADLKAFVASIIEEVGEGRHPR